MATVDNTLQPEEGNVLLSGTFHLFPRRKQLYSVRITPKALFYRPISSPNESESVILLSDVIGCHRRQGPPSDSAAYFTVYAYPFRKKRFSGKKTRYRLSITFGIQDFSSYEENRIVSDKWHRVIVTLSQGIIVEKEDVDTCHPVTRGKLKLLVNPHSGQGKAMQICTKQILPMLDEAEMKYEVITTEYAGHARELAMSLDLEDCYAIVIVSGDGLVYEVINGLMSRTDWMKAVKVPLGVLPGGSGNALCCSINYSAGEPFTENFVLHSTFVLLKHKVLPMDLVSIETYKEKVYSFLSTCIGLIADVDYESEKYRTLGGARFTVGAVKRIMGLKTYRFKISYLPIVEYETKESNQENDSKKTLTKVRTFSLHSKNSSFNNSTEIDVQEATEETEITSPMKSRSYSVPGIENPELENGDHFKPRTQSQAVFNERDKIESGEELLSSLLTDDVGQENGAGDPVRPLNDKDFNSDESLYSEDNGIIRESVTAIKELDAPVPTPLLSALGEPVPDNWVTIEDEFISVTALCQSHLNPDCMAAPTGRLSDGFIHLLLVRKAGVSRSTLVNLFLSMSDGSHVDSPHVEIIKALAFRFEPQDKEGIIMVDGEIVDFGPIQGHVLPQLARIMAIQ